MQQIAEIVVVGPSWRAASQHSAPHPPSPSRCGGITVNELPAIVIMKRIVTSRLNIEVNQLIYNRPLCVVSIKDRYAGSSDWWLRLFCLVGVLTIRYHSISSQM